MKKCYPSRKKILKEELIITTIITLVLPIFINLFFFQALPNPDGEEYKIVYSYSIVSLKTDKENNGVFILGTGAINNNEYYKFYKTTDHGTLKFTKVSVSSLELLRSDNEPPQLIKYQKYKEYCLPWKIWIKGKVEPVEDDTYQVLVIPSNAIQVQYDANL